MSVNLALRYPVRKRCGRCRCYFCWEVIDGLWCSLKCAGLQEISMDPEDWPREHYTFTPHGGSARKPKRNFLYQAVADRQAKKFGKTAYRCNYCFGWHIGTLNPNTDSAEPRRLVFPI